MSREIHTQQGNPRGVAQTRTTPSAGEWPERREAPGDLAEAGASLTALQPMRPEGGASPMMVQQAPDRINDPRGDTLEPSRAEWKARCLLAQSLISHRLDTDSPDVAAVLAVLRGDLTLAGAQ